MDFVTESRKKQNANRVGHTGLLSQKTELPPGMPRYPYSKFRNRVIIPVLIMSTNIAPIIGTMMKGCTA